MSAAIAIRVGLSESLADLFAPIDDKPIEALLGRHAQERATIERVASVFSDEQTTACLAYFVKGNDVREGYSVERMFGAKETAHAIKALDAAYWQRALDATDVFASMPASRRKEWHDQIHAMDVPPFNADALRSTLAEHLAARHRYFAERVDDLFRALSPDHRTNIAAGFRGKMILHNITNDWSGVSSRVDHIVDLRIVIARFMGREIVHEYDVRSLTESLVKDGRRNSRGEWVSVDGGAVELRLYDNGNCHVRVHDELAWRLNAVLASVNPGAIPESNKTRPAYSGTRPRKDPKARELIERPLPFAVLRVLANFNQRVEGLAPNEWMHGYGWSDLDKHVRAEAMRALESVGGVEMPNARSEGWGRVRFDYDATDVLREIISSGCVPDQRAHQYFPTPRHLAERIVELANIGSDDRVLEPSAGQGAIAELLPRERTICIEVNALHCAVLRAKGFTVIEADFLKVDPRAHAVTRVVMNPPFDHAQWRRHVEHAARMLQSDGARLVAILPSWARRDLLALPGFSLTWSEPIHDAFPGTSVSVVILQAERA